MLGMKVGKAMRTRHRRLAVVFVQGIVASLSNTKLVNSKLTSETGLCVLEAGACVAAEAVETNCSVRSFDSFMFCRKSRH